MSLKLSKNFKKLPIELVYDIVSYLDLEEILRIGIKDFDFIVEKKYRKKKYNFRDCIREETFHTFKYLYFNKKRKLTFPLLKFAIDYNYVPVVDLMFQEKRDIFESIEAIDYIFRHSKNCEIFEKGVIILLSLRDNISYIKDESSLEIFKTSIVYNIKYSFLARKNERIEEMKKIIYYCETLKTLFEDCSLKKFIAENYNMVEEDMIESYFQVLGDFKDPINILSILVLKSQFYLLKAYLDRGILKLGLYDIINIIDHNLEDNFVSLIENTCYLQEEELKYGNVSSTILLVIENKELNVYSQSIWRIKLLHRVREIIEHYI